jgi:hypothetical protein
MSGVLLLVGLVVAAIPGAAVAQNRDGTLPQPVATALRVVTSAPNVGVVRVACPWGTRSHAFAEDTFVDEGGTLLSTVELRVELRATRRTRGEDSRGRRKIFNKGALLGETSYVCDRGAGGSKLGDQPPLRGNDDEPFVVVEVLSGGAYLGETLRTQPVNVVVSARYPGGRTTVTRRTLRATRHRACEVTAGLKAQLPSGQLAGFEASLEDANCTFSLGAFVRVHEGREGLPDTVWFRLLRNGQEATRRSVRYTANSSLNMVEDDRARVLTLAIGDKLAVEYSVDGQTFQPLGAARVISE